MAQVLNVQQAVQDLAVIDKVVRLGTVTDGKRSYSVYCRVQYKDGRLSITGVEGPTLGGNCYGSCGQINMHLKPESVDPAPGWTRDSIAVFLRVWDRWHLNDMRAGTPAQENYLRLHPVTYKYPESHYETAGEALKEAGLNPDPSTTPPYAYGHAWIYEHVPAETLAYLEALPATDRKPAWV